VFLVTTMAETLASAQKSRPLKCILENLNHLERVLNDRVYEDVVLAELVFDKNSSF
jgi:hypothetical protein